MPRRVKAKIVMYMGLAIMFEQLATHQTAVLGTGLFLAALGYLEP